MNKKRILSIILSVGILSLLLLPGIHPGKAQDELQPAPNMPNTESIIPDLASTIGGDSYAIAYQDPYAYIGSWQYLLVLDVSNPFLPKLIGRTDILPGVPLDLAVVGNYAYIVAGSKGLWIFDISHPEAPTLVGLYDTPDYASDIVLSGNYAYIADGKSGLRIIDITDPTSPTQAGFYDTPNTTEGMSVAGNFVYLADGEGGLRIVDATDRAHPTEVGSNPTAAYSIGVAVSGNYAYVTEYWGYELLRVIDISNPGSPIEVGSFSNDLYDSAKRIVVADSYAYITAYTNYIPFYSEGGLLIIDISDPAALKEIASAGSAENMVVAGNYVYVAGFGLAIIDVTNPANPEQIGSYDPIHAGADIKIAGKYAYIADMDHGLRIIDISNPQMPTEAGSYDTPGTANEVAVIDKYAFVADKDEGLRIIDVSNPAYPIEVGFYDTPSCDAEHVAAAGKYAYVSCEGLRIIDVSNPSSPIEVGTFAQSPSGDLTVKGSYAYMLGGGGLTIVDISNPTSPIEASHISSYGNGIDVAGDYAYIISSTGGCNVNAGEPYHNPSAPFVSTLRIIDVSHPTAPVKIACYYVSYTGSPFSLGHSVVVAGNYAYVADGNNGLAIIDVSNPEAPSESGVSPGIFYNLAIEGNNVYLSDGTSMVILRLLTDKVISMIPVAGGSLSSTDGAAKFIFPSGAFTDTVNLTYWQLLYDENLTDLVGIRHTFDLSAVYSDTWQAATLAPGLTFTMTLQYTDTELGPAIENTLAFYNWDGVNWQMEVSSSLDLVGNQLTATPNHLSLWAVLGETNRIFLCIVSK